MATMAAAVAASMVQGVAGRDIRNGLPGWLQRAAGIAEQRPTMACSAESMTTKMPSSSVIELVDCREVPFSRGAELWQQRRRRAELSYINRPTLETP